jgi:anti-anti-sigma factor
MSTLHKGSHPGALGVGGDGVRTLVLSGELDIASCQAVEPAIAELAAHGAHKLTVDLHELTFMDLAGLRVILEANEHARAGGYELELVPGPPQVQRLFDHAGLIKVLPFR